jgi:hypothetical protein
VELDEVEGLLVHERIDDVDDHVVHELFDLGPVPTAREREHALLQTFHLLLVGADQQVDELRVGSAQQLTARDHSRPVHRP